MCEDDGFAFGWEVITSVRRFQHRMEVFMDQSLEPLGVSSLSIELSKRSNLNREMHIS